MAAGVTIFVAGIMVVLITGVTSSSLVHAMNVKFDYGGVRGPANWGRLSPAYVNCTQGKQQSPINIDSRELVKNKYLAPLTRDYKIANATLVDNGFNIALSWDEGAGILLVNGKNYTLKQLHWHSPAEHTIDGVRHPVELHLVHKSEDGGLSVVAILYEYGKTDPFLFQLKGNLEKLAKEAYGGEAAAHIPIGEVKTRPMKRGTRKYYRYVGSLTVPPCTENVVWNILGKVRQISKEQVHILKAPLDMGCRHNSRPLQPLNGRKVELYNEDDEDDED